MEDDRCRCCDESCSGLVDRKLICSYFNDCFGKCSRKKSQIFVGSSFSHGRIWCFSLSCLTVKKMCLVKFLEAFVDFNVYILWHLDLSGKIIIRLINNHNNAAQASYIKGLGRHWKILPIMDTIQIYTDIFPLCSMQRDFECRRPRKAKTLSRPVSLIGTSRLPYFDFFSDRSAFYFYNNIYIIILIFSIKNLMLLFHIKMPKKQLKL